MTNSKSTLIYIPDISGFTNFVNNTEINHSRHIISELLEIIIDSDKFGMSVSEIEGDAVLFFKEDVPSISDLIEQCQNTFINFHNHLRRYNTERICRCGACETAANLSLKFIVHKGNVEIISIKGHQKLYGSDVILAHMLLKNSIPENEYILITDQDELERSSIEIDKKEWITVKRGSDTYKNFGKYYYSFIPIKKLLKKLVEPSQISFPGLGPDKIIIEETINAPADLIYENLTNLDKRLEWNADIKEIILHENSLNKTGSVHTCLVGSYSLDIESIGRMETNNQIVFGERLNGFKGLRDVVKIYFFEQKESKTLVRVEVDFKIKSWIRKLMKPMVRRMLNKETKEGLNKLKIASEKNILQPLGIESNEN
jgi:uncharacterized protein YndB with AHSA1/START domain